MDVVGKLFLSKKEIKLIFASKIISMGDTANYRTEEAAADVRHPADDGPLHVGAALCTQPSFASSLPVHPGQVRADRVLKQH